MKSKITLQEQALIPGKKYLDSHNWNTIKFGELFGRILDTPKLIVLSLLLLLLFSFSLVQKFAAKFGFNQQILSSWSNDMISNEEEVNKALNEALIHIIKTKLSNYSKET